MASSGAFWPGTGCLGLFAGFFAGIALCAAVPSQHDPDTQAFGALFWGIGLAPVGAAIALITGAVMRAAMDTPPGTRPAPRQYGASAGIIAGVLLLVLLALTAVKRMATPSETPAAAVRPGITAPIPPPPSLGALSYPGMLLYPPVRGGFAARTPAAFPAVKSYFDGTLQGAGTDCSGNGVACGQWYATTPTGTHVVITARTIRARDLLQEGDSDVSVNTNGPTVIEYRIGP
jgi:hypothetical protein